MATTGDDIEVVQAIPAMRLQSITVLFALLVHSVETLDAIWRGKIFKVV